VMADTIRRKGFSGLYEGLTPWLVFSLPRSAIKFATFEFLMARQSRDTDLGAAPKGRRGRRNQSVKEPQQESDSTSSLRLRASFLCGGAAGAMEWGLAGTPMQNISIKMLHDANRSDGKQFKGLASAVYQIWKRL